MNGEGRGKDGESRTPKDDQEFAKLIYQHIELACNVMVATCELTDEDFARTIRVVPECVAALDVWGTIVDCMRGDRGEIDKEDWDRILILKKLSMAIDHRKRVERGRGTTESAENAVGCVRDIISWSILQLVEIYLHDGISRGEGHEEASLDSRVVSGLGCLAEYAASGKASQGFLRDVRAAVHPLVEKYKDERMEAAISGDRGENRPAGEK